MFNFLKKKKENTSNVSDELYAVASGELIAIDKVNDPVFSQKMMGEGYAVLPTSGVVYSPVVGEIMSIFPTKHALGIKMENGLEILLHMGIDTVELKGAPFDIKVKEGDKVTAETVVAHVDLDALKDAGKHNDLIVVITNSADSLDKIDLSKLGDVNEKDIIGKALSK